MTSATPGLNPETNDQKVIIGSNSLFKNFGANKWKAGVGSALFAVVGLGVLMRALAAPVALNTFEAENMTLTNQTVISRSKASGGKVALFHSNGSATTSVTVPGPATGFKIRALGQNCDGAPRIVVHIDGAQVGMITVKSTTLKDHGFNTQITPGLHTVSLTFDNDFTSRRCTRDVEVDRFYIFGDPVSSPTPPPTTPPPPPVPTPPPPPAVTPPPPTPTPPGTGTNSPCPTLALAGGSSLHSVTVPAAGIYSIWVRMSAQDAATTLTMSVDSLSTGQTCGVALKAPPGINVSAFNWFNTKSDGSVFSANLAQGAANVQLSVPGQYPNVSIDRILAVPGTCVPVDLGNNCVTQ